MTDFDYALTWEVVAGTAKAVDGDTVKAILKYDEYVGRGLRHTVYTGDDEGPAAVLVRLVIVDTPEKGKPGWREATSFVIKWISERMASGIMVETYDTGGWDRLMGDVYGAHDRTDTLTQALLYHGYGTYVP